MSYKKCQILSIEVIIENNLCDYLDNAADGIATAFKDLFRRQIQDIKIETVCRLIKYRLQDIDVVW